MPDSSGAITARKSVLSEINDRLAGITLEQVIPPKGLKPEDGECHFVGVMDDDLKCLHFLTATVIDEYNTLVEELEGFDDQLRKELRDERKLSPQAFLDEATARFQEKQVQLEMKRTFIEIVQSIFWLEVQRAFPALAPQHPYVIDNDWRVGWRDCGGGHGKRRGVSIIAIDMTGRGGLFADLFKTRG